MKPLEIRAMSEPSREQVNEIPGPLLLEFGASWCPHCQDIQAALATALAQHPEVQRLTIEDGKGKPLGRSFRVTLWPTLVFMLNGKIIHQTVRPSRSQIEHGFAELSQAQS